MEPRLAISDLSFSYGEKEVLRDICLELEKGETLCLLGPNGCGKTTLLNCIHGEFSLAKGGIFLDGGDVKRLKVVERARRIGYVFQEHSAPFPYPALEVVRMGRAPHLGFFEMPSDRDTEQAKAIMTSMRIDHLMDRAYTKISGGERQLVLIARALCQEPDVILLDEPTSHLDFRNQAMVLRTVRRLSQQGLTIIMTTHFPNHAWLFSGKVAMMKEGRLLKVGSATEVMTEDQLSETYGLRIRIYSAEGERDEVRFCTPLFDS